MKTLPLVKRSIALPLIGLTAVWSIMMFANWFSMVSQQNYDSVVQPTIYIYLFGLTVGTFSALIAHGWAVKSLTLDEGDALARAAVRFTVLALVIGLAVTTIFALTSFLSAFNSSSQNPDVLQRFIWTYLPILLATAVVVYVILRAFVFRSASVAAEGEAKPKMSERQKALALGYAVPILSTAFAIILGLFIYDATRTNLDTWVWVLIIAIVGVGVIFGTRFAARARQARVEAPKPKTALAAGAATVNFVLSIVFGATVSIMSFTMGASAIDKLRVYPAWVEGSNEQPMPTVSAPTLQWWLQDMAPAVVLLLLAAAGIYLSITERHRKQNLVVEA
jgi:heme/copper-type cytochrome/quinol oxidase subunit 2